MEKEHGFKHQHTPNGKSSKCPTKPSFCWGWSDISPCPRELLRCPEPVLFFTGIANAPAQKSAANPFELSCQCGSQRFSLARACSTCTAAERHPGN